jgi:hypothetical protein
VTLAGATGGSRVGAAGVWTKLVGVFGDWAKAAPLMSRKARAGRIRIEVFCVTFVSPIVVAAG